MAVSYSVPTTTNHIEREIERDFVGPGLGGPRSRHGAYHVDIIVSRLVTLTLDPCNQERDDWREMSFGVRQCRVAHWTTFALLEFGERQVRSPRMRRRVSLGLQQTSTPAPHPRARAWSRVIWRCWQDGVAYDPSRHRAGAMLAA
jgi:hypothetical protein